MFINANGYYYASVYCEDDRMRYPTGIKKVDKSKSATLHLNKISSIITKYVESQKIMGYPLLSTLLKEHLNIQLGKSAGSAFFSDWQQMLEDMRTGKMLKKYGDKYSEFTINVYAQHIVALEKYEKATGFKFTYRLTKDEYNSYISWLVQNQFSKNTISGIVGGMRKFFNSTYGKKHFNTISKEFRYGIETADSIYLNLEEITSIYDLELSGSEEAARDVFIFGCWVGLRVKDLRRINEYERNGNVFEVLTSKTSNKVIIPIHWMADKIYNKYNGKLPEYKSREAFAYHLPSICKKAGLNERKLISITKGGEKKAEYFYKYELVSPHTCRRSFATNLYKAGFLPKLIMAITGHTTEESFFKYLRISKEEGAQMMYNHPFLKEPGTTFSDPSFES